jgi:hypothetical protein
MRNKCTYINGRARIIFFISIVAGTKRGSKSGRAREWLINKTHVSSVLAIFDAALPAQINSSKAKSPRRKSSKTIFKLSLIEYKLLINGRRALCAPHTNQSRPAALFVKNQNGAAIFTYIRRQIAQLHVTRSHSFFSVGLRGGYVLLPLILLRDDAFVNERTL